jgi:hypothetical protein
MVLVETKTGKKISEIFALASGAGSNKATFYKKESELAGMSAEKVTIEYMHGLTSETDPDEFVLDFSEQDGTLANLGKYDWFGFEATLSNGKIENPVFNPYMAILKFPKDFDFGITATEADLVFGGGFNRSSTAGDITIKKVGFTNGKLSADVYAVVFTYINTGIPTTLKVADKTYALPEIPKPGKIYTVTINDLTPTMGGVQLWENGPYWAECNVGASKPEEYGYYFWWGDTVGYTNTGSGWISVKDGTSISFSSSGTAASTYDKSNSQLQSAGYIDSTGNLVAAHDAATAHLGAPWRMPTDAEFSALINNCTTTWITTNGVSGRLVTGTGAYANRSIFLPAAGIGGGSYLTSPGSYGYCWSSTPDSGYSYYAWNLYFGSGNVGRDYYGSRCGGRSVRPVRGFAE